MDPLRELFRYHSWATLRLLDHCALLSEPDLNGTVPGTYGTVHNTLWHIVAADGRYIHRLQTGRRKPPLPEGTPTPTLAELRSQFQEQMRVWEGLLDRVDELDVTMEPQPDEDPPWPATPHAEDLLIAQAVHHGNDHRTQICTYLGARNLPVPEIDVWAYWLETKHGIALTPA
jgi:uncharacterized damage-inducible protein DinB